MNPFVKNIFASCLGVGLAFLIVGFFGFILIVGIASSGDQKVKVSSKSVLHLKLNQPIPEQTNNLELDPFNLKDQHILGLNDIVETLEHAAGDDKIEGILIDMESGLGAGLAAATTLRNAILKFKESGKFVVAYSKYYTQGTYYIASAADKVYINPLGGLDFHGFSAMIPFFKDMLDHVGIKMQVFYAGDFKSATEPYRLNKMSDQNRLQLRAYLEPVFNNFLTEMGKSRNKSVAELRAIADGLKVRSAEDAVTYGLADQTGYIDEVIEDLKNRMELGEKDELKTIELEAYSQSFTKSRNTKAKDKIALVYAEGSILASDGARGTIVDDKYVKLLRKLRTDEKIKAIVLRVNSPGGSALASENIWRELTLAKDAGKKVVVSMGDYAASGGYYIACMADKIYAEPNTLTGSIGVFSMLPNASELFENKIGMHWDSVKTTNYSTGLNPFFDLAPEEQKYLQESTDEMYEIFLKRVADGRNMSRDSVHAIAQGRIWIGGIAKQIGLVDEIGGLTDAVKSAAELAGIEDYRISEYPYQKEPLQEFIEELTGQKDDDAIRSKLLKKELGGYYKHYENVREMLNMKGVQARLPVMIDFK
jgi:protease IV